ncbi:MAG: hypothetical protein IKH57_00190, partial [Clostridia bacterium]|nr:hypothetical protein [Clostridia bacterium]
ILIVGADSACLLCFPFLYPADIVLPSASLPFFLRIMQFIHRFSECSYERWVKEKHRHNCQCFQLLRVHDKIYWQCSQVTNWGLEWANWGLVMDNFLFLHRT